ncbi:MAG TPA: zf-TFIIB domain-containing protein [Candidatus Paceibacterota bacterium]|nr:zf-TFIIB domain-containing protein [Candidatus Paceibacterota bacterium]
MKCPKCEDQQLAGAAVRGIEVDRCPRCGGIWFDVKELGALMASHPSDLKPLARGKNDDSTDARAGLCPRDQSRMIRVRSARKPTVIVETCPTCRGLWLDGGELGELLLP